MEPSNANMTDSPKENEEFNKVIEAERARGRGRPKKNPQVDKMLDFVVDFYCMDKTDSQCTHDVTITYESDRIKSKPLGSDIIIKLYEYKDKPIPDHFKPYLNLYTKEEMEDLNNMGSSED